MDEWEQGLFEILEGDILEKTKKIEELLKISAYDFFDAREKHRVEVEKLKAYYKELREKK